MPQLYIIIIAFALLILMLIRRGYINISLRRLQIRYAQENRRKKKLEAKRVISKRKLEDQKTRQEEAIKNTRRHLAHINSFLKKTDLCISKGDIDEAIKLLIGILAIDDKHHRANETLAKLYMEQKQHNKAEMLYKKLIESYPNNPVYHSNLGHCFFNQKRFKESLEAYKNAIRLDQHKASRYANMAQALLAMNNLEEAIKTLEIAHKLDKKNTSYLFLLVDSHLAFRDPIKAREYVHTILEIEPYNNDAKELLKQIIGLLEE